MTKPIETYQTADFRGHSRWLLPEAKDLVHFPLNLNARRYNRKKCLSR